MADRTIGGLPLAPGLYDDSLLVIEQQGAAASLSGAQLKAYARKGVEVYVEGAKAAAEEAAQSAETASGSAAAAEASAQTAQQYSGKPPIVQAGYWWTWDAEQQKYVNTGKRSVLNFDKVYSSVAEMTADKDNVEGNTIAIISSSVDIPENAQIYIFNGTDWYYLADLSGFTGVGIQSITQTSGDHSPGTTDTYTIICTDGSSYTFTVENGPPGPPGEKGEPGTSFTVRGRYDTLDELKAAHPIGSEGEAWAVGSAEDNEVYLWDVDDLEWKSVGGLQGTPGKDGDPGTPGAPGNPGVTFTPFISADGVLRWTNNGGLDNPAPVNVKGGPGDPGAPGAPGTPGKSAYQYAVDGGYTGTEADFQALVASGPWLPTAGGTMTGTINLPNSSSDTSPAFTSSQTSTYTGQPCLKIYKDDNNRSNIRFGANASSPASGKEVIIRGVATPVNSTDAANKKYVDDAVAGVSGSGDYLPLSGGTLTGNLTLKGSGNYGTKINLGDGDYVHFSEPKDDELEIKAKKVNFVLSDTSDSKFTVNGNPLSGGGGGLTYVDAYIIGDGGTQRFTVDTSYVYLMVAYSGSGDGTGVAVVDTDVVTSTYKYISFGSHTFYRSSKDQHAYYEAHAYVDGSTVSIRNNTGEDIKVAVYRMPRLIL